MQALSRHPNRRPGFRRAPSPAGDAGPLPLVAALSAPAATDSNLAGRKAAVLAAAAAAGFPVLPGFVITTAGCVALTAVGGAVAAPAAVRREIDEAWAALSEDGERTLVVRSSSPGEDGATSSMAGQFTSVLGVVGHEAFLAAVDRVVASAAVAGPADDGDEPPMAVLVQPQVWPRWGGVLFGVDPVSGRTDRLALATVEGGPDRLVSGTVDGSRATLTRRGRLLRLDGPDGAPRLARRHRVALARLAARAARTFGSPQDIEWAVDAKRGLLLLQSRPVTAIGTVADPRAPVLGPGPVAETFPDPLSLLEAELWLEPLRMALAEAVALTGAASRRQLAASPVITSVGGRAAADLRLLGVAPGRRSVLARLDPRPPARRVRAAWRTGRLRMALPALAADLVERADEELASVGQPSTLADAQLLAALRGSHQALVSLNAHEILAGMLSPSPADSGGAATSAGTALAVVAAARTSGLADDEIVARHPVVLSLFPPAVGATTSLPEVLVLPPTAPSGVAADPLVVWREALRLRVRWVQELTAVVAAELGARLVRRDLLPDADAVRWLHLDELEAAVTAGRVPGDLDARRRPARAAPLPAAFRLAPGDVVVPVDLVGRGGGQGAGGGRALGRVVHADDGTAERGAILVTRTLDPGLAPLLPALGGLVAETGSVLSHLAILARELGVPTVVGVTGAIDRFPPGSVVVVDGTAGEVTPVETADSP